MLLIFMIIFGASVSIFALAAVCDEVSRERSDCLLILYFSVAAGSGISMFFVHAIQYAASILK